MTIYSENWYYKGRDNADNIIYNYTDEQVEKWRDRCMYTPREVSIMSLIETKKEDAKIEDLPFPPTDDDVEYFNSTKEEYLRWKEETGFYHRFRFIGE